LNCLAGAKYSQEKKASHVISIPPLAGFLLWYGSLSTERVIRRE
jgi:hypothetical protein